MIRGISSFLFTFTFCLFVPLIARDNIRIETFRGSEIAPYIQEVVTLCDGIYREYPYFYNGDNAEYTAYVESYSQSNDAVICLAFDGENAIGLAIGTPMSKTRDLYKPTLIEHGYDLDHLFYLGEFGVTSDYRDRGIEEELYLKIENSIKKADLFSMICVWELENSDLESSLQGKFWKEQGFIRNSDLNFQIFWTNIGDMKESAHLAVYSIKNL